MIFKQLGILSVFTLMISSSAFGTPMDPETKKIFFDGLQLRKKIQRIYRQEPHLYRSPAFQDIQQWTLGNQNYKGRHGQIFFQVTVTSPQHVNASLLKRAYSKYLLKMNQLVVEIPDQVDLHMGMIEDDKYRASQILDIKTTLSGISLGHLDRWILKCDYLAQPLMATWFTAVALEHLDKIGKLQGLVGWNQFKTRLQESQGLLSLEVLRQRISDAKYIPL